MQVGSILSLGSETLEALRSPASFLTQRFLGEKEREEVPSVVEPAKKADTNEGVRAWEVAYLAQKMGVRRFLKLVQRVRRARFGGQGGRAPDATAEELSEKCFHALLERDITCVRDGLYPRRLLFQRPSFGSLLRLGGALRERLGGEGELDAHRRRGALWAELEAELLLLGGADIVRRMVVPPLRELGRQRLRVLDVASGTGSLLEQLHAALPEAELHGLDCDPKSVRSARRRIGRLPCLSLVVGEAESMLFRDCEFDAVTCVFLFHEVSAEVRRRMASEMARVLRPGGRLVLCDWVQSRDRDAQVRHPIDAFPDVAGLPHYAQYIQEPLEEIVEGAGLRVETSEVLYLAKRVVARKPLPAEVN